MLTIGLRLPIETATTRFDQLTGSGFRTPVFQVIVPVGGAVLFQLAQVKIGESARFIFSSNSSFDRPMNVSSLFLAILPFPGDIRLGRFPRLGHIPRVNELSSCRPCHSSLIVEFRHK